MGEVSYPPHGPGDDHEKLDAPEYEGRVACADRNEKEEQKHDIRKLETEGEHDPEHGARSAYGGDVWIADEMPHKGDDTSPHTGEEIEHEKPMLAPALLQGSAEEKEGIHIEKEMDEASMEEHVGEDLPDPAELTYQDRKEGENGEKQSVALKGERKGLISFLRERGDEPIRRGEAQHLCAEKNHDIDDYEPCHDASDAQSALHHPQYPPAAGLWISCEYILTPCPESSVIFATVEKYPAGALSYANCV